MSQRSASTSGLSDIVSRNLNPFRSHHVIVHDLSIATSHWAVSGHAPETYPTGRLVRLRVSGRSCIFDCKSGGAFPSVLTIGLLKTRHTPQLSKHTLVPLDGYAACIAKPAGPAEDSDHLCRFAVRKNQFWSIHYNLRAEPWRPHRLQDLRR